MIGSVNADTTVYVRNLPRRGETVSSGRLHRGAGGKGANQAIAAAALHESSSLVAAVGADLEAARTMGVLAARSVDLTWVKPHDNASTGMALITVDSDGENTIVLSAGANALLSNDHVAAALAEGAPGDIALVGCEIPVSTVEFAVQEAARLGARVMLNLAPYTRLAPEILAVAEFLFVNEVEADQLLADLGSHSGDEPARALSRLTPATVVVTAGGRGAVIARDGEVLYEHPACAPAGVVDTVGAGDAFVGSFAGAIGAGDNLETALRVAIIAAGISVGRRGASESYADRNAIRAAMSRPRSSS